MPYHRFWVILQKISCVCPLFSIDNQNNNIMLKKDFKNLFLLFVALLAGATQSSAYKQEKVPVRVNGTTRSMEVFVPDNMEKDLPLMLNTHGMNQDPEYQMGADKMYELIDKERFVLAYLRSKADKTWDIGGNSDQKFVEQAIVELYTRYDIDPHRVYWTGFSMGSMLMYHCMPNMQGKIAAFAPTSGINFSEQPWNRCKRPVNLIHCHAYGDDVFGYEKYNIRSYVESMANMNKSHYYNKTTGYHAPGGWFDGDKEVWTNDEGNLVELYSYNNGGHWPQQANSAEIWNFCKQFRIADENLDPIEKGAAPGGTYSPNPETEQQGDADKLDGKTLVATDADCTSLWYVNNAIETPQNLRCGSFADVEENPMCFFKFHKVGRVNCATKGNLYTIQMADETGATYSLWGSNGYLNTPPGAWCLFALGLEGGNGKYKYGEDADYCGLWKVDYVEGKGYTIQNVGVSEANDGGAYITPLSATPVNDVSYVRLFAKLKYTAPSGIADIVADRPADNRTYDLMGRQVTNLRPGMIYIKGGKKHIR